MRQLTATEYRNSVNALTGKKVDISGYPEVSVVEGFDNDVEVLSVGASLAQYLQKRAEALAEELVNDGQFLADYAGCSDSDGDACALSLIEDFGAKVFRRPVEPGERDQFLGLYDWGKEKTDAERGVRLVLQAMLQDPHFIHRVEQASDGPASGYELATRLSYFLWQSTPDAELLAAARGELESREGLEAQARRMMEAPAFADMAASFHRQWLRLDVIDSASKDDALYPGFDSSLRHDLRLETEELVKDVVNTGKFEDLFTSTRAFLNESTAAIYGVPGVTGSELRPVELDPSERRGILTRAGFLAAWATQDGTSPIRRGVFIRERILCSPLPPPPPDVDNVTPPVDPSLTRRDQVDQMTSTDACRGCHSLINPVGFLFESYDAVGGFQISDNGREIDSSGTVIGAGDADGSYANAVEFSNALGLSERVQECAIKNWWRFSVGRHTGAADKCELAKLKESFAQSGGDIRQLLLDVVLSDSFRNRTSEEI